MVIVPPLGVTASSAWAAGAAVAAMTMAVAALSSARARVALRL